MFFSIGSTSLVVSGQYGGPVISLDRGVVTIFTSSGEQISAWKWNNSPAFAAGWSDQEEALFVLEDGTVLIYSMFGMFKSTFSMGQEAKDIKILSAKIFPSPPTLAQEWQCRPPPTGSTWSPPPPSPG